MHAVSRDGRPAQINAVGRRYRRRQLSFCRTPTPATTAMFGEISTLTPGGRRV